MDSSLTREIRACNDIVEVIASYITLQPAGKNFKALCPFHQEKTPSFTVSPEKQLWHCFGCGAGGDVFAFVQKIENISFPEAVQKLAQRVGLRWRSSAADQKLESERAAVLSLNELAARFFEENLWRSAAGRKARDYLKQRGVWEETAKKFRLGFAPDAWDVLYKHLLSQKVNPLDAEKAGLLVRTETGDRFYDRFRDRLIFPIFSPHGECIGFGGRALGDSEPKYLNTPETPLFSKRKTLYGLNLAAQSIREKDFALLVEGYMDVVSLHQHGFQNAVATMGTALTSTALSVLKRYTRNLVVAFDSDSSGMQAVLRSAGLFREQEVRVRVVMLPDELDPDECVKKLGEEVFQKAIEDSVTLTDYRILRFVSTPEGEVPTEEAVRQAVQVLLEVQSPTEREEGLRKLTKLWAKDEPERAVRLEAALRRELARVRARLMRHATRYTRHEPVPVESLAPSESLPLNVRLAEAELLAGMLQDRKLAEQVLSVIKPQEFVQERYQKLASIVSGCLQSGDFGELTEYLLQLSDEAVKAEATKLMLMDTSLLDAKGAIESRIQVLRRYRLRQQAKEALAAMVAKQVEGPVARSDPLFQKVWGIQHQLLLQKEPSSQLPPSPFSSSHPSD